MSEGRAQFKHPAVGHMVVDFMVFAAVDRPEQRITVFLPSSKADSICKMRTLVDAFGAADSDPL